METPPDADLLREYARTRSDAAFAAIVRRHADLVYGSAVRRTRDRHLAEDVTQAVFLLLARRAADLRPGVSLPGWLYQTAGHVSADAMKTARRRAAHERAAAALRTESDAATVADGDELSPHLDAALDRLPAADRVAVLLRYVAGRTVAEVAAATAVSEAAAAKRLWRALERIRKNLAARGVTTPAAAIGTALAVPTHAPAALVDACLRLPSPGSAAAALAGHAPRVGRWWPVAAASGVAAAVAVVALAAGGSRPAVGPAAAVAAPATGPAVAAAGGGDPLVPASPEQERAVRAAVYTLRHAQPWGRPERWVAAVRELADVGRPAVPELVAELDRATRDAELRTLAFTLRAIGDPRACPALIRAIRRTPPASSDLGLTVRDPALAEFVRVHEATATAAGTGLTLGRSVRELRTALEAITGHSVGDPARPRPGWVDEARAARGRDALADAWQRWWDARGDGLVTAADLATLTAGPHDAAAVEAAGVAVHGPLFPTGRPYRLGPVRDLVLQPDDLPFDVPTLVSFDRGEAMSRLDALGRLPAGTVVDLPGPWEFGPPVSADAWCGQVTYPTGPATRPAGRPGAALLLSPADLSSAVCVLHANGEDVWPAAAGVWDTLAGDVEAGRPVAPDPRGPFNQFEGPRPGDAAGPPPLPATFLFRTDAGGAGVVQLLAAGTDGRHLHLRYRMIEPSPTPATRAAAPPPPPPGTASFGPVVEVTLPAIAAGADCALVLRTGKLAAAPAGPAAANPHAWAHDAGANVVVVANAAAAAVGLRLIDAAVLPVGDDAFDRLPPAVVASAAGHVRPRPHDDPHVVDAFLVPGDATGGSATAVFVAADGSAGLVRVVRVTPAAVTLRCKLLGASGIPANRAATRE